MAPDSVLELWTGPGVCRPPRLLPRRSASARQRCPPAGGHGTRAAPGGKVGLRAQLGGGRRGRVCLQPGDGQAQQHLAVLRRARRHGLQQPRHLPRATPCASPACEPGAWRGRALAAQSLDPRCPASGGALVPAAPAQVAPALYQAYESACLKLRCPAPTLLLEAAPASAPAAPAQARPPAPTSRALQKGCLACCAAPVQDMLSSFALGQVTSTPYSNARLFHRAVRPPIAQSAPQPAWLPRSPVQKPSRGRQAQNCAQAALSLALHRAPAAHPAAS